MALAAPAARDYRLTGPEATRAAERGLVAADWYHSDVPRARMKQLMRRRDAPAIRDSAIWLGGLITTGVGGVLTWGTWWCVPLLAVYGVLYGSAGDSRWHECGHGTAFRTRWLNDAVYQLASFMMMREPTVWRWRHIRHHSDTIIVGRDPEIDAMRPPDVASILLNVFSIRHVTEGIVKLFYHAAGRLTPHEAAFIPDQARPAVSRVARWWLAIYAAVGAATIASGSWLPLMLVGLPTFYGGWLSLYLSLTQHAGLAEDVLDHRLNARTVRMNPIFRFLYWNMNYHVEHHMFPMVPYHALPALHREIADDLPTPYPSTIAAYREIIPTLIRQRRDPSHFVRRELPATARPFRAELHDA